MRTNFQENENKKINHSKSRLFSKNISFIERRRDREKKIK